ncbi:Putative FAD-containing monooxygenase MymA [Zhongshania aliphaticivorans]|uniref:FAD-containing monooxygenase MymA n=1 Tax=Zhongshania aliphaticivorans TaxID=1470434 RepID=A0A5S9Q3D4_9GAMM|nr:NAD(P)/FAD-dependent oxidoreductase [Zhongshania aliphaticivorans]CAA0111415.1 Putative FAD-containing monooxygenase MymA [Zhongshania aliphaticivorans]CAA0118619.1 Putative FAD-containing monooxygenase MymA [Zhongshania aliphaticivorans]
MNKSNHFDVLIIGAGLSGIGTACHIADECPNKSLAIIERRETLGGTWDLFRYPGIRSDSDMLSFGYKFRPWNELNTLADGSAIRNYISDTAEEYRVRDKIHFGLKVIAADWSTNDGQWLLTTQHEASGETREYTCSYLISCTGYYNHDTAFRPDFPGEERFKGITIHPQQWPENLDYSNKRVVVIGSGATAVTLIPAMADETAHITMLQRSPSYIFSLPGYDKMTEVLSKLMPKNWAYGIARKRNIFFQRALYLACRRWPKAMKKVLLSQVRKHLGPDIDMRHFTPNYMPWDERLCAVPDANLFKVLREGKASIETDHIETFTEKGILLKSGKELEADIIITATGLNLQMLGGLKMSVDQQPRPLEGQLTYKSILVENIPNMAWIFGYVNAPWTLKSEISGKYLCRLFKYMEQNDVNVVVPQDRDNCALDDGIMDSLQAGYVQRGKYSLPRQGSKLPWQVLMHYGRDKKMLLDEPINNSALTFSKATKNRVTTKAAA